MEEETRLNVIDEEEIPRSTAKSEADKPREEITLKLGFLKRIQFWQFTSIILLVFFVVSLFFVSTADVTGNVISETEAKSKVEGYVKNILAGRAAPSFGDIEEENGLYKVPLTLQGQNIDSYITKDGKVFFPTGINLDEIASNGNVGVNEDIVEAEAVEVEFDENEDPVLVEKNAPVTIVEFSDFQCPFCERFASQTFDRIKTDYVDTGKVRFVYRDFPLEAIHNDARKSAEAAQCAHEQEKFWEYHDKLFENQDALSFDDLKEYAQDAGLDTDKFNDCLDNEKYKDEVQKDLDDGEKYGVTGTPAFFINGKLLSGAQPFENFKAVIETELAKSK